MVRHMAVKCFLERRALEIEGQRSNNEPSPPCHCQLPERTEHGYLFVGPRNTARIYKKSRQDAMSLLRHRSPVLRDGWSLAAPSGHYGSSLQTRNKNQTPPGLFESSACRSSKIYFHRNVRQPAPK